MLFYQPGNSLSDLFSSPIAHRQVDVEAGVAGGALHCSGKSVLEMLGQGFLVPHVLDPPVGEPRELICEVLDNDGQVIQLARFPGPQVVGGQQVQGYNLHTLLFTPRQELMNLVGPGTMAVSAGFQRSQFCPPPVAIQNHGDVLGFGEALNFFEDATTVEAIEKTFTEEIPKPLHRTTLVLSPPVGYLPQSSADFLGPTSTVKA